MHFQTKKWFLSPLTSKIPKTFIINIKNMLTVYGTLSKFFFLSAKYLVNCLQWFNNEALPIVCHRNTLKTLFCHLKGNVWDQWLWYFGNFREMLFYMTTVTLNPYSKTHYTNLIFHFHLLPKLVVDFFMTQINLFFHLSFQ